MSIIFPHVAKRCRTCLVGCLLGIALASSTGGLVTHCVAAETAEPLAPQSFRVTPQDTSAARQSFRVRSGFRVELVAAEPLIRECGLIGISQHVRRRAVRPQTIQNHSHLGTCPKLA